MEKYRQPVFWLLLSTLALSGCNAERLQNAVVQLDTSTSKATTAFRTYYDGLNDFRRDYYFTTLRFRPNREMGEIESIKIKVPKIPQGNTMPADPAVATGTTEEMSITQSTGLIDYYSQPEIAARLGALKALSDYTQGLAKLAGANVGEEAKTEVRGITDNMKSIAAHIQSFSKKKGDTFANYAGPIGELAGIAAEAWLNAKQSKDLRQCVIDGAPKVDALLKLLDRDFQLTDQTVDTLGKNQVLQYYIDFYNDNYVIALKPEPESKPKSELEGKPKFSALVIDKERIEFLNQAQHAANSLSTLKHFEPAGFLAALKKAHEHVLKLAENKATDEESFKELLSDLSNLMNEADRVSRAAEQIAAANQSKQK
jgi:hypothetical protein